jgi:hypothetical protein
MRIFAKVGSPSRSTDIWVDSLQSSLSVPLIVQTNAVSLLLFLIFLKFFLLRFADFI